MTEDYCLNANTPDRYCNWKTCGSWEDCAAACEFDVANATFCGYCHGGECTNVAGVDLADCPGTRACLKADGSLSLLNPGDSVGLVLFFCAALSLTKPHRRKCARGQQRGPQDNAILLVQHQRASRGAWQRVSAMLQTLPISTYFPGPSFLASLMTV